MSYLQLPNNVQFNGERQFIALAENDEAIAITIPNPAPVGALITNVTNDDNDGPVNARICFSGLDTANRAFNLASRESIYIPNLAMLQRLLLSTDGGISISGASFEIEFTSLI